MYQGISRSQIERELEDKGDFVKIDYLTKVLEKEVPINIRKFIYLKLAELYENRNMHKESAKIFDKIASMSVTFRDKIKYHTREAELYIKLGDFKRVDEAVKKAMNHANASQKAEINFFIKMFCKRQAETYEKELKRNNARRIYEKLLEIVQTNSEKREIKKKLLVLYEKLGRLKEYFALKKSLEEYSEL